MVRQPQAASLLLVGRRDVAALAGVLASAEPGQSVHGARRRIKQLRSLLRLLRGGVSGTACVKANAALRTAADALAGERRAEALARAAEKLEPMAEYSATIWMRAARQSG